MKQLQKQFYGRQEIAELLKVDINDNKHFKRNIENKLTKWGYSFEYSRKGVEITRQPETAEERLSEIIIREYDLDIQIEITEFANFIYLLLVDEEFISMPWGKRVEYMKEQLDLDISESTLKRWAKKLLDMNLVAKDKISRTYWATFYTRLSIRSTRKSKMTLVARPMRQNGRSHDLWNCTKPTLHNELRSLWNISAQRLCRNWGDRPKLWSSPLPDIVL